ncbi:C-type lectin domain family 4 member G [Kryptolebias marmoratus]|uniref:C-type lectin domain family 4 member G n=1 Tax=Kryptolebias marmoratus TaxID=37003 RepID=UPI0007F9240D|nr:C-type lectin domain family 4 member G [Kryptolebias marmoratus]
MEDEVNYSTLVFINRPATRTEKNEHQTVYSEVKSSFQLETAVTKANEDQTIYSEVKPKAVAKEKEELATHSVRKPEEPAAADLKAKTATNRQTLLLSACLGTLCVFLLVAVIVLSVRILTQTKSQETTIREFKAKNDQLNVENRNLTDRTERLAVENRSLANKTEQLTEETTRLEDLTQELRNDTKLLKEEIQVLGNRMEQLVKNMSVLQNQTERLTKERNDLNWTLEIILTYNNFPIQDFCPNKKCQPCRPSWILFQKKCYLFYEDTPWKTWSQSQQFCQNKFADLVVIDNLQEQEFVSNHSKYYFDKWHGYWLGLQKINNIWVWVDEHNDALGFWVPVSYDNNYGLLVPGTPPRQSWRAEKTTSNQKFICEGEALISPN